MESFDLAGFQQHWVNIEDHSDASILFAGPIEPRMGNMTACLKLWPLQVKRPQTMSAGQR
jgi:hypothetical protein